MNTEDTGSIIEPRTITVNDTDPIGSDAPEWLEAKVDLLFPLKTATETISSLTLREPDAEQLEEIEKRARNKLNYAAVRETVAVLSGVPVDDLKKLNARDLRRLVVAVNPLMGMDEEDEVTT